MSRENPNNYDTRFTGKLGLKNKIPPLSIRFPPDVLETLKSREDTQDFVRAAVIEKLEREAKLPPSGKVLEDSIAPTPEPTPKKSTTTRKPASKGAIAPKKPAARKNPTTTKTEGTITRATKNKPL